MFFGISILAESTWVSLLKIALPIMIGGALTIINWLFNRRAKLKDDSSSLSATNYKTEIEQTNKQREFIITENQTLYSLLKEELEACRKERIELDATIAELNKRLLKVEIELQAWEMGLKTPKGYILQKVEDDTDEKA